MSPNPFVTLCGDIEMHHFDGHYNVLLGQIDERRHLWFALDHLRNFHIDEQLVIQALAFALGLLDTCIISPHWLCVIEYVSDRYRADWYHHIRRLQ